MTSSSEFLAVLDLVEMLLLHPRTGVLIGLLTTAAVSDVRTGRIPNWLVFSGALYALAYNALYPRDMGILFALGGLSVGLVALLPGYLLRVLGAGDVKLMAMV
jgi:prepilin peptidase CpaA